MAQVEYTGRDNLELMREAKNYNAYLLQLICSSAQQGDSVVDFGAGNGTFSCPLASAGYTVICVETDPVLGAGLEKRGLRVLSDFEQAEDGSVDYIYSLNVLEHIKDDIGTAAVWYRKLRPGGRLLVYVPAFQILFSSMDVKVGHVRRYSKSELAQKLQSIGFEITESRYADSMGFAATLAYKLLGKGDGGINSTMLKFYDGWVFPLSRLIDRVSHRIGGKNVYVRATKPLNCN